MKYKRRIDRIAKSIDEIKAARCGLRIIIQKPGQTIEQAKAGVDINAEDFVIVIRKFSDGKPIAQKPVKSIPTKPEELDREIKQLQRDLLKDGYSARKIAELMADDTTTLPGDNEVGIQN